MLVSKAYPAEPTLPLFASPLRSQQFPGKPVGPLDQVLDYLDAPLALTVTTAPLPGAKV